MLSTDIAQQLRQLLTALETATLFQRLLGLLTERQRLVDDQVARMGPAAGNALNDAATQIHSVYVHAHQAMQGLSLRIVYKQIEEVAKAFAAYEGSAPNDASVEMASELHSFAASIDNYSTSHSPKDAVEVLKNAASLQRRLEQSRRVMTGMLQKLDPAKPVPEGYGVLTVVIQGNQDLHGIIDVLQSLQELLALLERIFKELGIEVEFSLHKLETGSLSWEVFAQKVGIAALKHLMIKGVEIWQHSSTIEGQLKHQIPLHANAIKEALKVRNLLKREGFDVEGLDDSISQQAEFLVQRIGKITGGGQRVRVDGQAFDRQQPRMNSLPMQAPAPQIENRPSTSDGEQS